LTATIDSLLAGARRRLGAAPFGPPRREAALLLGHVLGLSEAQVLARGGEAVDATDASRFEALLARRLMGEPVAYLVGEREFFGRPFFVDPRVLIPRPETEHLVEAVLALAPALPPRPRLLDLGTGSGCLAITLALELAGARVVATDVSPAALAVALSNARRHGVLARSTPASAADPAPGPGGHLALAAPALAGALRLAVSDLAAALRLAAFDLVVSNPPYVGSEDASRLSPEVRDFEPGVALFAGPGGLAFIERLLAEAAGLKPGASLAFEIGDGQLAGVEALLAGRPFALLEVRHDLAGKPRVVVLRRA
jgi:release factor glutamine methyltransferase